MPISSSRSVRTPRVGVGGDDGEGLAVAKKSCVTLRHRSQITLIVLCFSASMNGSGIEPGQLTELAQEVGGGEQADRRLQVWPVELLAELTAKLAIHADVDVRIRQPRRHPRYASRAGTPG